jgi:hypothetical protein
MPELTRRYIVMTMGTEAPFDLSDPEGHFVLKPWKDPAALRALEAYREHCYEELAEEIARWIDVIASGPPVLGGVGARNEEHMRARAVAAPAAPRARGARPGRAPRRAAGKPRSRVKVKTKPAKRKNVKKKQR